MRELTEVALIPVVNDDAVPAEISLREADCGASTVSVITATTANAMDPPTLEHVSPTLIVEEERNEEDESNTRGNEYSFTRDPAPAPAASTKTENKWASGSLRVVEFRNKSIRKGSEVLKQQYRPPTRASKVHSKTRNSGGMKVLGVRKSTSFKSRHRSSSSATKSIQETKIEASTEQSFRSTDNGEMPISALDRSFMETVDEENEQHYHEMEPIVTVIFSKQSKTETDSVATVEKDLATIQEDTTPLETTVSNEKEDSAKRDEEVESMKNEGAEKSQEETVRYQERNIHDNKDRSHSRGMLLLHKLNDTADEETIKIEEKEAVRTHETT